MAKKFKKRAKKRVIKKRKTKKYKKKKNIGAGIDLQKVVDFKFQALGKIYKNFTKKLERENKIFLSYSSPRITPFQTI